MPSELSDVERLTAELRSTDAEIAQVEEEAAHEWCMTFIWPRGCVGSVRNARNS